MTVTKPAPIFSLPINETLADLTMASAASTAPTNPFVSTRPNAWLIVVFLPVVVVLVAFVRVTSAG